MKDSILKPPSWDKFCKCVLFSCFLSSPLPFLYAFADRAAERLQGEVRFSERGLLLQGATCPFSNCWITRKQKQLRWAKCFWVGKVIYTQLYTITLTLFVTLVVSCSVAAVIGSVWLDKQMVTIVTHHSELWNYSKNPASRNNVSILRGFTPLVAFGIH